MADIETAGFKAAVNAVRGTSWEWGRWDLNPDQRVSSRRGATPPVLGTQGSSLQLVITESANPLSVKPITGARQSTGLAYVPLASRNPQGRI